jgi:predicted Zn-dependent peptidase
VAGIILEELKRFKTELITEEELSSAKEQLKGQLLLSMESTDNRMTKLAKNEIYLGRNLALDEILGEFDRVTREKIRKVAEFILRDNHLNLQLVGKVREADFPMCRI